jgi:glycine cleavage system H lipoate-binding protein
MVALAVVVIVIGFLLIDLLIQKLQPAARGQEVGFGRSMFPRPSDMLTGFRIPRGYLFHPGHTWAVSDHAESRSSSNHSPVRVGADDFAIKILGRIENIRLPRRGAAITAGEPIFTLIQGSKEIDFPAPVNGTVVEVNNELIRQPDRLSADPYQSGWIAMINPDNRADLDRLARDETCAEKLRHDVRRFRDFLVEAAGRESDLGVTLADGGAPRRGVLEEFGSRDWERFQEEFLRMKRSRRVEQ